MSRHDTWMPLYVGDYLADTLHLTTRQHGAYLLLLMHAWRNEGFIPHNPEELAAVSRMSGKEWAKDGACILRFFDEDPSGEGGYFCHQRVMKELAVAEAMTQQRSKAGKASAAKRERERQRDGNEIPTGDGLPLPPRTKPLPSPSPSPDSEAKASGADAPPVDMTKLAFDAGVRVMTASGMTESNARSLVGKWRKAHGDEAVFKVLGDCQRQSITEPASWIEAALKAGAKPTRKPWEKAPIDGLPPSEDWPARMRGYRPGVIWWKTNDWGPEPGQPGCRVPPSVLAEWQQQVAA